VPLVAKKMRAEFLRSAILGRLVVGLGLLALASAVVALVVSTRSRVPTEAHADSPPTSSARWRPADPSSPAATAGPSSSAWQPPKWSTEEDPRWKVGVPMRPMDRDIIAALQSGHIERTAELDLFPDKPYQVRLSGNPTMQQFRFVLVDLNRDGKWDEKWDLGEPGQIKRSVPHDPDGAGHDVMYTLVNGRWQPH
jgi:hypothetical protein